MENNNPALIILKAMWAVGADRDKTFYLGSSERKIIEAMIRAFYPDIILKEKPEGIDE